MRVDCALLCDAATVREGLLHILGGGVTRAARPEYPSPLGVVLAMRLNLHPTEAGTHEGSILIQAEDGERIADIGFEFGVGPGSDSDLLPGEELSLPFVVPLNNVGVPAPGRYSIEVLMDRHHLATVAFAMTTLNTEELPQ